MIDSSNALFGASIVGSLVICLAVLWHLFLTLLNYKAELGLGFTAPSEGIHKDSTYIVKLATCPEVGNSHLVAS